MKVKKMLKITQTEFSEIIIKNIVLGTSGYHFKMADIGFKKQAEPGDE